MKKLLLLIFLFLIFNSNSYSLDIKSEHIDYLLKKVINEYNIRPLPTKPFEQSKKYMLGQSLFFDPLLSGNRDISCATCHLLNKGGADGTAFSLGSGAIGLAENRIMPEGRPLQGRNAPGLWNRDNNRLTSMFWDGSIEVLNLPNLRFRTPLGESLPEGFDNLMAAQALFPLIREDEMLGLEGDYSQSNLSNSHANLINDFTSSTKEMSYEDSALHIYKLLIKRLIFNDKPQPWEKEYRKLFTDAYPSKNIKEITIVDIGNALSHFQEIAFSTRDTRWSKYLKGDKDSINKDEKIGALLFYGRARCAVCHNGPVFSDFDYYSVGVQDYGPGMNESGIDYGRYYVTGNEDDKYKFKTPSLINSTITAPYFHNGSIDNLYDVIVKHINPLANADQYTESGSFMMKLVEIKAISPILTKGINISGKEIYQLIAFLRTLEDDAKQYEDLIIPKGVPSGLKISAIK